MSQEATPRHALRYLFVGQSQKELTHNEALMRMDGLLHPVVDAWQVAPPAGLSMSDDGKCWLIKAPAAGHWVGKENQIAQWNGGSWRYLDPVIGMTVWHATQNVRLFYIGGSWQAMPAIPDPVGGATMDVEARAAVSSILLHLREIGGIAS
jgi:Protein of unknown function (DUF2793)